MSMSEHEEIKGQLLLHWIEDLRNDKQPGWHDEMESLQQSDIDEVMEQARFLKGAIYPSIQSSPDIGSYAKKLGDIVQTRQRKQVEANRLLATKISGFAELVRETIKAQNVNVPALLNSLTMAEPVFRELETGELPPHRLPIDKMIGLLFALRLTFKDVVERIRESSNQWLLDEYPKEQTQLARIDSKVSNQERRRLMESENDAMKEKAQIDLYCDKLSKILHQGG